MKAHEHLLKCLADSHIDYTVSVLDEENKCVLARSPVFKSDGLIAVLNAVNEFESFCTLRIRESTKLVYSYAIVYLDSHHENVALGENDMANVFDNWILAWEDYLALAGANND